MKGGTAHTTALLGLALAACAALSGCHDSRALKAQPVQIAADGPPAVAMARGIVEVPGGITEIMAPQDAVVQSVAVNDGDSVRAGQLLMRLSASAWQHEVGIATAELRLAQARQRAQQQRLPGAERQAQRLTEAVRLEAVDAQRADEARQALADLRAAVEVASAETALARRKLAQAQAQGQRLAVLAPHDGSVLRVLVQAGARVSAQAAKPLLTLLPARALRLRAEVNEAFIGRIKLGMRARIRLDGDALDAATGARADAALPAARVVRVSPLFGASRLDDEAAARGSVRVVDCFLEFDRPPPLRIGQTLRVEFHD